MQKQKTKTPTDDQSRRRKEEEDIHVYNQEYEVPEEEIGGSNYGENEDIPSSFPDKQNKKIKVGKTTHKHHVSNLVLKSKTHVLKEQIYEIKTSPTYAYMYKGGTA